MQELTNLTPTNRCATAGLAIQAVQVDAECRFLNALPTHVYIAHDRHGTALYVGMTGSLRYRLTTHKTSSIWWHLVDELAVETFPNRRLAAARETYLIMTLAPRYNRTDETWRHRDEVVRELLMLGLTQTEIAWELEMSVAPISRSVRRLREAGLLDDLHVRTNGKSRRQLRRLAARSRAHQVGV